MHIINDPEINRFSSCLIGIPVFHKLGLQLLTLCSITHELEKNVEDKNL
jgi:hypothetical protein